jgi:hypothetical protein
MKSVLHSSRGPAPSPISLVFLTLAAGIGFADWLWAREAGFTVAGHAYARLAAISGFLWLVGWFYETRRPEPRLAAMLTCAAFLVGFTAAGSVLNAMLLTVAGPRMDWFFARADIAMGFDWPAMMRVMANYPTSLAILEQAYAALLPEIALGVVLLATFCGASPVYRFSLAVAVGALICIFIWTFFPAFGAMSVYALDPATAVRLHVPVDWAYGETLVRMLGEGPGLIAPDNMKGLIGFPSYHVVLALLLMWYFRFLPKFRWVVWVVNGLVIVATPIEGGHHGIDVLAAFPVAFLAVVIADRSYGLTASRSGESAKARPGGERPAECLDARQSA